MKDADSGQPMNGPLKEGQDYEIENGLFVFTSSYLARRGYCCGSGCRNCPYEPKHLGKHPRAAADLKRREPNQEGS